METPNQRLIRVRERRYPSASDAARAMGMPVPTYAAHENGSRGLTLDAAERYARFFRISLDWLATGRGSSNNPDPKQPTMVPKLSWVSAGDWWLPEQITDISSLPHIEVTDLPSGDWAALEVQGSSMDRISPPGSIILLNRSESRLVPNGCYVISDEEGRATYKRYRPSPDRFEPVTFSPGHDTIFPSGPIGVIGRVRRSMIDM